MKKYFTLILFLIFAFSFGQNLNSYKYASIPSKFSFLREADQYQLNSLTKFLMEKQGFTAYLDTDELPEDFILNNCNKIFVDVSSSGNFMGTKLKVILKDCKNNVLFTSAEGKSKSKDYKTAYQEALREAFRSFATLNYVYKPSPNQTNTTVVKEIAVVETVKPIAEPTVITNEENLFAQPILNGFQIIDSTPKIIMKIYKTSNKNCFIAVKGSSQGVLILKDDFWYFEYYQNDKLISEKINVKL